MNAIKVLSQRSGQIMVESLLTLVLFVAIATFIMNQVKTNQWFATLISSPWAAVSSMVENGVWTANVKVARSENPIQFSRVISFRGKNEP